MDLNYKALVKSNSESDRGEQMKSVVRVDVLRCTILNNTDPNN